LLEKASIINLMAQEAALKNKAANETTPEEEEAIV
jgi:hypothetical protein